MLSTGSYTAIEVYILLDRGAIFVDDVSAPMVQSLRDPPLHIPTRRESLRQNLTEMMGEFQSMKEWIVSRV